jgi:hypothetical protein
MVATGYVDLGPRGPLTGVKDSSGLNPGNWTISFTPDILTCNVPQFEVYKMVVEGAANTTFDVYRENKQWDTAIYGTRNSWDPQQPLIVIPGMTVYFLYSDPATDGTPPVATIWLRYNPALWPMGNA